MTLLDPMMWLSWFFYSASLVSLFLFSWITGIIRGFISLFSAHFLFAHGFSFFLQLVYFLLITLSVFFFSYEFYRWIANACNLHIRPTHFYYASFPFSVAKDSYPLQQDNYSTIFPAPSWKLQNCFFPTSRPKIVFKKIIR